MEQGAGRQDSNERFLAAALAWLRLRLAWYIGRHNPAATQVGQVGDNQLAEAAAQVRAAAALEPPPALVTLGQALDLSLFEQQTLLLCAALDLDTRIGRLCALAQDNPNQPYPTLALALTLFERPSWEIVSPNRPLRYWQLVEMSRTGHQPLTTSPLRADERVLNYLKGVNYLDDRLATLLAPVHETAGQLAPSQAAVAEAITDRIAPLLASQPLVVIQLLGADPATKEMLAHAAAARFGRQLFRLPAQLLPALPEQMDLLLRLWQREQLLLPVALYVDALEGDEQLLGDNLGGPLHRFLDRASGLVFLNTQDVRSDLGPATIAFDAVRPSPPEQRAAWRAAIGATAPDAPDLLASQFNLNLADIDGILQSLRPGGLADARPLPERVWDACLKHTRPRLDTLAQRLSPIATWEDIVLPQPSLMLLHEIVQQVRLRGKVYDDWGFRRRMNRGLGVVALFGGESGTGKTMAAEVIANDLWLNLYRIDLSAVVSKYIGETEKNLRRLFDAAEDGGAVLFFDEADALFGKRSQVKDSHDRYANIEVNYLLQRLEAYGGLAILATNLRSSLDDAFVRRIRFIVTFPIPEPADRLRLWQKIFPPETPVGALDFARLAEFKLTGGSIYNVALNAAFLAAHAASPVTMPIVLHAVRTELLKSDRLLNEDDFVWQ